MTEEASTPPRRYTMRARARAVERTRERIIEATANAAATRRLALITLEDIAESAGVSVQTILRQFGSRAGLLEATTRHVREAVIKERRPPANDVGQAIRVLVDHYEARGDAVLLLLSQENDDPHARAIVTVGKRVHRAWVAEVFDQFVHGDERSIDLLVVVTDVYTWKLLRRDRRLSRAQTEQRMKDLVAAVLASLNGSTDV